MADKFPGIAASISSLFDSLTASQQSLTLYHLLLTTKSPSEHQAILAKVLQCHSLDPEVSLPSSQGGNEDDIVLFLDFIDKMVSRKLEAHERSQENGATPTTPPAPNPQAGRKRKLKASPERTQTKRLVLEAGQGESGEEVMESEETQSNKIGDVVYPAHALPSRYTQDQPQPKKQPS